MPSPLTLIVRDVSVETPRTRVVRVSLEGRTFDFKAGQYVWVGLEGQELRKPYSIASSPEESRADDALTLLVLVGSDGSAGEHLGVPTPGAHFTVDGPNGHRWFPDNPVERDFLFVAGGAGIAPVRAMIRHAMAVVPDARLTLVYSARTPDEFAFGAEMRAHAAAGRLRLRERVTRDASGTWRGEAGRITAGLLREAVTTAATLCFVFGPPPLVADVVEWLRADGIRQERIVAEGI